MERETQERVSYTEEFKGIQENINSSLLTTLRLPRNLTLGGQKTVKRLFTPNINAIRNKNKGKLANECKVSKHSKTSPRRSSKRLNNKGKLLQSEGIFSQGIGNGNRPNHNSEKHSLFRGGYTQSITASLVMPTINKSQQHMNMYDEKNLIESLLADPECDSESDLEDDMPITLPLEVSKGFTELNELNSPHIHTNHTKKEMSDEEDQHQMFNKSPLFDIKPIIKVEKPEIEETNFISCLHASKLYNDDNPALTLVKLPDSFPGKVCKDDANDKNKDFTLQDMQDGLIGKILLRKSGNIELVAKNTKYVLIADRARNDVNTAVLFPGKQTISSEPSLVTLGSVAEMMCLAPNWDCLFDRAKKKPSFYY